MATIHLPTRMIMHLSNMLAEHGPKMDMLPFKFTNSSAAATAASTEAMAAEGGGDGECHYTADELAPRTLLLTFCFMCFALTGACVVCEKYFFFSLRLIGQRLRLPDDIAGATLMAISTSFSELCASFLDVFFFQNNIGIGTVVGGGVFSLFVIIGSAAIATRTPLELEGKALLRETVFYSVIVLVVCLSIRDGYFQWYESLMLVTWYMVYVIVLTLQSNGIITSADQEPNVMSSRFARTHLLESSLMLRSEMGPYSEGSDHYAVRLTSPHPHTHPMWFASYQNSMDHQRECVRKFKAAVRAVIFVRKLSLETIQRSSALNLGQQLDDAASGSYQKDIRQLPAEPEEGILGRTLRRHSIANILSGTSATREALQSFVKSAQQRASQSRTKRGFHFFSSEPATDDIGSTEDGFQQTATASTISPTVQLSRISKSHDLSNPINTINNSSNINSHELPTSIPDNNDSPMQKEHSIKRALCSCWCVSALASFLYHYTTLCFFHFLRIIKHIFSISFAKSVVYFILLVPIRPWIFVLSLTVPNCKTHKWREWYILTFCICLAWIWSLVWIVVDCASLVGCGVGIPPAVMGLTIISFGSGIPDVVSSVTAARNGLGSMTVSYAFGSNIFIFSVCLGLPYLLKTTIVSPGSQIIIIEDHFTRPTVVLIVSFVVTLFALNWSNWYLNKTMGAVLLTCYVAFVLHTTIKHLA
eukprot:c10355_g1_i1.p1 GENE.c10355_g1_i1~~c10355_g1_i1.p1  ORF type:complete len:703 (+),score=119.27 c10355_g1_i1:425-2533(+)